MSKGGTSCRTIGIHHVKLNTKCSKFGRSSKSKTNKIILGVKLDHQPINFIRVVLFFLFFA